MLAVVAPASPLRRFAPADLFRVDIAPRPVPAPAPEFISVDFIYVGIAPPGAATDHAVERGLPRILRGANRPPGRFRKLKQSESQVFVMLGVVLVWLGVVRSRRRRHPAVEGRRRLAA